MGGGPQLRNGTSVNPCAQEPIEDDQNPFQPAATTLTPAAVLVTTLPFFTAVLDLANNLEPLTIDSGSSDDTSELLPVLRTAKPSQTQPAVSDVSDSEDVPMTKQGREAKDVQPFIHKHEGSRWCKFCECVIL